MTSETAQRATALFQELWQEWVEHAEMQADAACGVISSHLDSEIEKLLLVGLMFMRPEELGCGYGGPLDFQHLSVIPQYPIGPYKADFAILITSPWFEGELRLAVECDGHNFHEKTKAQALHDKRRDRYFLAQGWATIRFTGSEIFADARKCANEVSDLIDGMIAAERERCLRKTGNGK